MCGVCEYSPWDHEEFIRQLGVAIGRAVGETRASMGQPTPLEEIPAAFRRQV
jgi:hypothetical protein